MFRAVLALALMWFGLGGAHASADGFEAALRSADPEAIAAQLPEDMALNGAPRVLALLGGPPRRFGKADYVAGWRLLKQAMPGLKVEAVERRAFKGGVTYRFVVSGLFTGGLGRYPATNLPVRVDAADTLLIQKGKITAIETQTDNLALLRALSHPVAVTAPVQLAPAEEVWRATPGAFVESLADDGKGGLIMTMLFEGRIDLLTPDKQVKTLARLPDFIPGEPGVICVIRDADGMVYATVHNGAERSIWRLRPDGMFSRFAYLPAEASPNGIALDGLGGLIVADSRGGLWRAKLSDRSVRRWLEHPALSGRDYIGLYPASNGVQLGGGRLFVANSDRGHFSAIELRPDATPGPLAIVARNTPGDDFAVDAAGRAFITTHPFNTIIEAAPDGQTKVIGDVTTGVLGPTAAILRREGEALWLYVANDGGIYAGLPKEQQKPGIVRLRIE